MCECHPRAAGRVVDLQRNYRVIVRRPVPFLNHVHAVGLPLSSFVPAENRESFRKPQEGTRLLSLKVWFVLHH